MENRVDVFDGCHLLGAACSRKEAVNNSGHLNGAICEGCSKDAQPMLNECSTDV